MKQESLEAEQPKTTNKNELVNAIPESMIDELRQEARKQALSIRHTWKQKGNRLVCEACPYPHAAILDSSVRMIGVSENGQPIFRRLK